MKVLVTGGCGYVGSALVPALISKGHSVTVYDSMITGECRFDPSPDLRIVKAGTADFRALARAAYRQDAVIHLAFVSSDQSYGLDPRLGREMNIGGLRNVLDACETNGIGKIVFPSSCSVYGKQSGRLSEGSALMPLGPYASQKVECEEILKRWAGRTRVECIVLRPATICGMSPKFRTDLVFNRMAAEAHLKGRIMVPNPGSIRPLLVMDDMIGIYLACLAKRFNDGQGDTFNAAFENRTLLESAALISKACQGGSQVVIDGEDTDARSYHVDSSSLESALYRPSGSLLSAASEIGRHLLEGGLGDVLDDPRFDNKRMYGDFARTFSRRAGPGVTAVGSEVGDPGLPRQR